MRRDFNYTEPVIGEEGRAGAAMLGLLARDEGDGTAKAVVGAQTGDGANVMMDATGPATDAINGRRTSFGQGKVGAFLTAKEPAGETDIAVDDETGFADKDAVAIFNASSGGTPTSPEYRLISGSPGGGVITLNAGLTADKFKGARIVKLIAYDAALGEQNQPGIKSQLQAPSAVEISVADGGSTDIDVTVTTNDEDEATHYDVYVREARFRSIEPGWIPDLANQSAATIGAGAVTATTFEGGADCVPDGGGGTLAASTYYVAVIAKNGSGVRDVDESRISNVEEITIT